MNVECSEPDGLGTGKWNVIGPAVSSGQRKARLDSLLQPAFRGALISGFLFQQLKRPMIRCGFIIAPEHASKYRIRF